MFYPFGGCQTIPEVSMNSITLQNVETHGGILWPGVIRCNETNPCNGFVFDNVKHHAWWSILGWNYFTDNVNGVVIDSKPVPAFNNQKEISNDLFDLPIGWFSGFIETWSAFIRYYSDSCLTVNETTTCHAEWKILLAKKTA